MTGRRLAAVGLAVLVWAVVAQVAEGAKARAQSVNNSPSSNNAQAAKSAPTAKVLPIKGPARAPSELPLGTGGTRLSPEAEASASVSMSGGDPLVENGLSSPLCREGEAAELSSVAVRDCRISHFEAAQAPTGNYGFDVHLNIGVGDWANDLDSEILNPVQWSWTLLVAVVHVVIVIVVNVDL